MIRSNLNMPWIKKEDCIGCGICVEKCSVDAIELEDEKAYINENECIRCGVCHDVCPQDAVRHDSERIPFEVEDNIQWVKNLLENYNTETEKDAFITRIKKHFNKERTVIKKTLDKIDLISRK